MKKVIWIKNEILNSSVDYHYIYQNNLDNDIWITGTLEVNNGTKRNVISHSLNL